MIGQPANFSVTTIGAPMLVYQWRKNSNSLAGEIATNYSIGSVTAGDAGYYDVLVTNLSSGVTSSVALLNVVPVPALTLTNSGKGLVLGADNGAVSNRFLVQMTTNLAAPAVWVPIQTNVIGADGKISFTETNSVDPFRFYRLLFP